VVGKPKKSGNGTGTDPKIVSEMLGHAITLDTYSHILPNMRDQAAAMEEALS